MPIASLSELAPELLLHLFKSLDSHGTIVSLNSASTKFYRIWRLNTLSISNAVLPRSIACFEEAQTLLKVQYPSVIEETGQSPHQFSLQHNRRLVSNASVVAKAELGIILHSADKWLLRCYGQQDFRRLYYCHWTATALSDNEERQHAYLDTLKILNLYGIQLMAMGRHGANNHGHNYAATLLFEYPAMVDKMEDIIMRKCYTAPFEEVTEVVETFGVCSWSGPSHLALTVNASARNMYCTISPSPQP